MKKFVCGMVVLMGTAAPSKGADSPSDVAWAAGSAASKASTTASWNMGAASGAKTTNWRIYNEAYTNFQNNYPDNTDVANALTEALNALKAADSYYDSSTNEYVWGSSYLANGSADFVARNFNSALTWFTAANSFFNGSSSDAYNAINNYQCAGNSVVYANNLMH